MYLVFLIINYRIRYIRAILKQRKKRINILEAEYYRNLQLIS